MRPELRSAFRARQASAAITALGVLAALLTVLAPTAQAVATLPQGFADETVWSGLTNPVNIEFAPDGTVFVAEKGGEIKVFDSASDATPSAFGTGLSRPCTTSGTAGCLAWRSTRSSRPGRMSMSCTPMTMFSGPAPRHRAGVMAAPTRLAPPTRAASSVAGCPG